MVYHYEGTCLIANFNSHKVIHECLHTHQGISSSEPHGSLLHCLYSNKKEENLIIPMMRERDMASPLHAIQILVHSDPFCWGRRGRIQWDHACSPCCISTRPEAWGLRLQSSSISNCSGKVGLLFCICLWFP